MMSSNLTSRNSSSSKRSATNSANGRLKKKEVEYRKLNAQLEEKTASLVKEAEDIMRENLQASLTTSNKDNQLVDHSQETSDLSLDIEKTVRELEERLNKQAHVYEEPDKTGEQVIPLVAEDLGSEAMVRFLKAKLHVTQEEVEKLNKTVLDMEKKYLATSTELKTLTEQKKKSEKVQQTLQSNLTKYQQLAKDLQMKCDGLEGQVLTLKRELEAEKSSQKKTTQSHSSTEVRLNRALEEVEKYKELCHRLKTNSKDATKQDKHLMESLETRNKVLERQKKELLAAFHKQMKFIDILKRQKIHLEAARMLAFTEEEFVKVLDWDT